MMTDEREEGRGFTVSDRRRFTPETGEARGDAPEERAAAETAADAAGDLGTSAPPLPEITLSTFVISLSTQVLMHLGEIPNPVDNTVHRDLSSAKQVIDILGMLQQRTKGNLDESEEALFDSVLYDLRMRYVQLFSAKQR
jgi:hypothetical protein